MIRSDHRFEGYGSETLDRIEDQYRIGSHDTDSTHVKPSTKAIKVNNPLIVVC